MPISIDALPDALLVTSGSNLITFPHHRPKWRERRLKRSSALESAVAQPEASFGGEELYPDLASQAAALGHSLIQNHPFVDGNKRIGHGAMEVFLLLNGHEIEASVDEQENIIIGVASGKISRNELSEWLHGHVTARNRL